MRQHRGLSGASHALDQQLAATLGGEQPVLDGLDVQVPAHEPVLGGRLLGHHRLPLVERGEFRNSP